MPYRINGDEVRARLRVFTEADISDTQLATDAFIPASEAWLDLTLDKKGKEWDDFSSTQQVLLKTCQVLRCCISVVNSAPEEQYKNSLQDFKGTPADWKEQTIGAYEREIAENIRLCGLNTRRSGGGYSGGSDYLPTGTVSVYE